MFFRTYFGTNLLEITVLVRKFNHKVSKINHIFEKSEQK